MRTEISQFLALETIVQVAQDSDTILATRTHSSPFTARVVKALPTYKTRHQGKYSPPPPNA